MLKIGIIGSGNVANHLAIALHKKNVRIVSVFSKTTANAEKLSALVKAKVAHSIDEVQVDTDVILVAVSDNAIANIYAQLVDYSGIIAHTSGSIPLIERQGYSGVFYPLQTFSKGVELNISTTPFCIEGNSTESGEALTQLAKLISENVQYVTSEQREQIHLAAVFACNFTNHMWRISEEILAEKNMPLSILDPLIQETYKKAFQNGAKTSQTGPAARKDHKILKKQKKKLKTHPKWKKIYLRVSKSIISDSNE